MTVEVEVVVVVGLLAVAVRGRAPGRPLWPGRRRRRAGDDPFVRHRKIRHALAWAGMSARHYDQVTRPMLRDVLAATLAEHHRVDLRTQPDEARRLVGPELWPLVDPARPASNDSHARGVDPAAIQAFVDRLEELARGGRR